MKAIRACIRVIFIICLTLSVLIFGSVIYLTSRLEAEYKVPYGEALSIDSLLPVTTEFIGADPTEKKLNTEKSSTFPVEIKLFGSIPVSLAQVEFVDESYVAVMGNPFGIKLYTEGVLVIDISSVTTVSGEKTPAADAGLLKGDYIISANGDSISSNEALSEIVADSNGKSIELLIKRNGIKKKLFVIPCFSEETSKYQIGVWVRDSSAGIGTLTFYSPSSGILCGLGHGICDSDTGSLFSVDFGQMVSAEITGIKKGENGAPGELKGTLKSNILADIVENSEIGVFGSLCGKIDKYSLTEIALKQEIKNGEAKLLCSLEGSTPRYYSCTVKKRSSAEHSKTQNLIVTVTDKELLKKTGGIVQGMSGSPIIQNGKLIGAITHVLVDDPSCGYAIFAENMLKSVSSLKDSTFEANIAS